MNSIIATNVSESFPIRGLHYSLAREAWQGLDDRRLG
jgi:hypothetical protein